MAKLFFSLIFAFLVLLILSFNINSDFYTYLRMFESFNRMNIYTFLYSVKDNTIIVYLINTISNFLGQDDIFSTKLLFFSQALIHSLVIFNLSGIKYGSILLFTDLQQIDLNQVRYGIALSFMTIASRRILMESRTRNYILRRLNNYLLIIIGFFLHFQSIFLILVTYLSKLKLKYTVMISSSIIIFIPIFLNITGITRRYINTVYDMESRLGINIIFYFSAIILILIWFSQIEPNKLKSIKFKRLEIKFGEKYLPQYLLPILIFIIGFFMISKSPAYQGRIITGLYSALIYLVAIRIDLQKRTYGAQNIKPYLPLYLIIPFIFIGLYRLIVLQGNVYRLIS